MKIEKIQTEQGAIASVTSDTPVITDVQSALDLLMTVRYETGAERMAINKEAVAEEFFRLRSGLAGEVLQKFVNYRMKLEMMQAIATDGSGCSRNL